ncbi:MAG: hypothetical protein MUC41_17235 [Syntrophobacteraceae bacterium]|jgi:hypothetical protein|nr:hypothetical protein [Syntrophobacteraceae bacterium]
MGFEALLSFIESYIVVKNEKIPKSAPTTSDWDCGLAGEFEDSYADAGRGERLEKARAAVERAFEEYVDERIKAVLAGKTGQAGVHPPVSRTVPDH